MSHNWEQARLGDLMLPDSPIIYGILQPGPEVDDGVPYVRPSEIRDDGSIDLANIRRTSQEIGAKYSRATLRTGDLLISIVGTIGKLAVVPTELDGGNITQSSARIRPAPELLDGKYLYHVLRSPMLVRQYDRARLGTGVPRLNIAHVRDLRIPCPSIGEQKRIAAILDNVDAIRRKRQQAIALTEDLLRSTFLDSVGPGADGYDGWAPVPVEELTESRKGSIRSGPFGSALRHAEFVDSGIAVLGIDNAVKNRFEWAERRFITEEKYEELRRYTVFPGDVLITIMGTTGRSAVVPDDIPAAITTKHLATLTLQRDVVEPEFLSHAIHMHPSVLRQIGSANRGAIMAGLNLGLIRKLEIRVPPIQAQRDFVGALARIRTLQMKLERSLTDDLLASLSQRAFAGQL